MRKAACFLSLLVVLVFACTGCSLFVKQLDVTVQSLDVVSLDSSGLGMELYLTVKNPNSFDLKLLGYNYDLKVMALPLAKGGARDEVTFPAGADTDLRLPVKVAYADLVELFKRRPDPERIPYSLQAGLDLETPMRHLTVPVNRTGTYAVPKQYRPGNILNRLGDFFNQNR